MVKRPVRVIHAEYLRDYLIKLRFNDETEKVVDFSRWLRGDVFKLLSDKREFKRFFVAGGTVSWPNGADIAPETLRDARDATTEERSISRVLTRGLTRR
jgi:hypothetical protein